MLKLTKINAFLDAENGITISLSFSGVSNAKMVCEGLCALNSCLAGEAVAGTLGFINLATQIYAMFKAHK